MLSETEPLKSILRCLNFLGLQFDNLKLWKKIAVSCCFFSFVFCSWLLMFMSMLQTAQSSVFLDRFMFTVMYFNTLVKPIIMFWKYKDILALISKLDKFCTEFIAESFVKRFRKKALTFAFVHMSLASFAFIASITASLNNEKSTIPAYAFGDLEENPFFRNFMFLRRTLSALYTNFLMTFLDLLLLNLMMILIECFKFLEDFILHYDVKNRRDFLKIVEMHRSLKS